MGARFFVALISFLGVLLSANSQLYGSYGYPTYGQYFQGQNPVYYPYPYQPYVSNPPIPYTPYYGYPAYPGYGYPAQQSYPAYPQYSNFPSNYLPLPYASNGTRNETEPDPYADVKVDIIDIEPQYFSYYKRFFNLEDNAYPVNVIDDTSGGGGSAPAQSQPSYTVKTESKSFNYSSVPQGVHTHDVKTRTYSFKRTFTVDPSKKGNSVINLNFVNGVQVTTEAPEGGLEAQTEAIVPAAEETTTAVPTTTESEEPSNILTWI